MNSRYEWTVYRETMSFYGVAHDRLSGVVADRQTVVRATVSPGFVPDGADRPIGVWSIPPTMALARKATETRNARAFDDRPNHRRLARARDHVLTASWRGSASTRGST